MPLAMLVSIKKQMFSYCIPLGFILPIHSLTHRLSGQPKN